MSRRKARELAFKVLFQLDQVDADVKDSFTYLLPEINLIEKDQEFSWLLIEGTRSHLNEIDSILQNYSKEWTIERMPAVDRNILRLGIYELLFEQGMQPAIAIDEAIELAKRYGEGNSPAFINAVLDKVRKNYGTN